MGYEIDVATIIKDKMITQNEIQEKKLKKFATLLRIPRLHFEYIEKHGVDEFVDFCEDIVKRERSLLDVEKAEKERLNLRNDYSIVKLNK